MHLGHDIIEGRSRIQARVGREALPHVKDETVGVYERTGHDKRRPRGQRLQPGQVEHETEPEDQAGDLEHVPGELVHPVEVLEQNGAGQSAQPARAAQEINEGLYEHGEVLGAQGLEHVRALALVELGMGEHGRRNDAQNPRGQLQRRRPLGLEVTLCVSACRLVHRLLCRGFIMF